MPFHTIIPACLCSGQNFRYKSGTPRSIDLEIHANKDEKVIMFDIDEKPDKISNFREYCGMCGSHQKICDLMIFYFSETSKDKVRKKPKILCLVESKGLAIEDALEQIENTFSKIHEKFSNKDCHYYPVKWSAYILTNRMGSMHTPEREEYERRLRKIIQSKNCKISDKGDITEFLRRIN
ncbi:MAG: hypothetical protein ACYDDV_11095 [Methanoregula sp.]